MKRCLISICLLAHTLFCQGSNSTKHNEQPLPPQQATWKTILQKHLIKTTVVSLISIAGSILLYRRYKSQKNGNDIIESNDNKSNHHKPSDSETGFSKKNNKKEVKQLLKQLENPNLNNYENVFTELADLLSKQSTKDLDDIKPVMDFIEAQTNENRRKDAFSRLEGILFSDETIENWLIKMLNQSTNKLQNGNSFWVKQQINNIVKNLATINHDKAADILEEMIKEQNSKKNENIIISLINGLSILKENSKLINLFGEYEAPNIQSKIIDSINTESKNTTIQNQLQKLADQENKSNVKAAILQKIYEYKFLDIHNSDKPLNEFIKSFQHNTEEPVRIGLLSLLEDKDKYLEKNIEHKEARELLYQTAINKDYSPDLRIAAANALYSFKNGNPTDVIMNHLMKDDNEDMKSKAISYLKWEVFEEAEMVNRYLESLIYLLKNDSFSRIEYKKSIIEALKKGKDKRITSALGYVQKSDSNEKVRKAAKSALDEMNSENKTKNLNISNSNISTDKTASPPSLIEPAKNDSKTLEPTNPNIPTGRKPQSLVELVNDNRREKVKNLLEELDNSDLKKRKQAFTTLVQLLESDSIKGFDAIAPFIKTMEKEQDKSFRSLILRKIKNLLSPDPTIENWLVKMLQRPENDKNQHIAIASNLAEINYDKAMKILLEMLNSQNNNHNLPIHVDALAHISRKESNKPLITLAKNHENPVIREKAISAIDMTKNDPDEDTLIEILSIEKDINVQKAIIEQLGKSISKITIFPQLLSNNLFDKLIKVFEDNQNKPEVQTELLKAISKLQRRKINHPKTKNLLIQTAKNIKRPSDLRIAATEALIVFEEQQQVIKLVMENLIKDPNKEVIEGGVNILIGKATKENMSDKYITTLTELLKKYSQNNTNEDIREYIIYALEEINAPKVLETLKYIQENDSSTEVRNAAKYVLEQINSQ